MSRRCDVCGGRNADELTADVRLLWPSVAKWVRHVCAACRAMFQRSAEKMKAAA